MDRDEDRKLIQHLARLRREPPFRVEVTGRVMAEVRGMRAPSRAGTPRAAWAWAAAALVLLVALCGAALSGLRLEELGRLAGLGADVWSQALGRGLSAVGSLAKVGAGALEVVRSFRGLAPLLGPAIAAALAAALLGMAGLTSFVVGRDLRRAPAGRRS